MPVERESNGRLTVVEAETAFLVAWEDAPDDWLARFEKRPGFPAQAWAENMVRVYNRRLAGQDDGPPTPPGKQPDSYHP